jgi:hypothetical protein
MYQKERYLVNGGKSTSIELRIFLMIYFMSVKDTG